MRLPNTLTLACAGHRDQVAGAVHRRGRRRGRGDHGEKRGDAGRILLAITATQAKALRLRKATTLGTSPVTTLAAGKPTTVKVAGSFTYRKRLRAAKRGKATILVVRGRRRPDLHRRWRVDAPALISARDR